MRVGWGLGWASTGAAWLRRVEEGYATTAVGEEDYLNSNRSDSDGGQRQYGERAGGTGKTDKTATGGAAGFWVRLVLAGTKEGAAAGSNSKRDKEDGRGRTRSYSI